MNVKVTKAPSGSEVIHHLDGGPNGIIEFGLEISHQQVAKLPVNPEKLTDVFWAKARSFAWRNEEQTNFEATGLLLPMDQGCLRCPVGFTYRHTAPSTYEFEIHY